MTTDTETYCARQKEKGKVTVRLLPVHAALKKRFEDTPDFSKDWDLGFRIAHEGQTIEVAFGNRWERRTSLSCRAYILDGTSLRDVHVGWDAEIVEGSIRKIYFPPSPYMGTSSLMAHIGKGIKKGRIGR